MPEDPSGTGRTPSTSPQETQKRLLWFTLVVGVLALILGGVQLQKNLRKPFTLAFLATNTNTNNASIDALQAKDTDKDGLTDYDELYVYHTSPYIADSDSDGVQDGKEVQDGTDPNCPDNITHQPCGVVSTNQNANSSAVNGSSLTTDDKALAAQIRQSLAASGVSQTDLQSVDDATLIQQYQSIVAEQGANANVADANTADTNAPNANLNGVTSVDQLSTLTTDQIRQLLQANGVPQATLDSYDDATIRAIYLNALQQAVSTNANTNA